jgi:acyl-CoA synthetase (NDP forming)
MTRTHRKPIVVCLLGDAARTPAVTRELERRGIPVAEDMGRGARMLAAVARGR